MCRYNNYKLTDMIFNTKNEKYIAPAMEVIDVTIEAGFIASTGGDLTFGDGINDGWTNLN